MLPNVTGEFRIGTEPELRFTPSGMAVCSARAVATSRKKNEADEWVDDKTCWVKLTAFKNLAENMAESIEKGHLVLVNGRLQTEDWETKEGEKRTDLVVMLNTIGPSLAFDTAKVSKAQRAASGSSSGGSSAPAEDPWATPAQPDEPPF